MAIALDQSLSRLYYADASAHARSFGTAPTAGSKVTVEILGWQNGTGGVFDVTSVTDNKGNTYTKDKLQQFGPFATAIFSANNVTSGGTFTITVTPTNANGLSGVQSWSAHSWTGMGTAPTVNTGGTNSANTASPHSLSFNPSVSNCLALYLQQDSWAVAGSGTWTNPSGSWTNIWHQDSNTELIGTLNYATAIASGSTSVGSTFSNTDLDTHAGIVISYAPSTGGTLPTVTITSSSVSLGTATISGTLTTVAGSPSVTVNLSRSGGGSASAVATVVSTTWSATVSLTEGTWTPTASITDANGTNTSSAGSALEVVGITGTTYVPSVYTSTSITAVPSSATVAPGGTTSIQVQDQNGVALSGATATSSNTARFTVTGTSNSSGNLTVTGVTAGTATLNISYVDSSAPATTLTTTASITVSNTAPTITSNGAAATASVSVASGTSVVTTVAAYDPDTSQTLTYYIAGGADAAKFSIGSSSGVLSFNTPPIYSSPTDSDLNNVYVVVVGVSDGTASDTQTLSVTVVNTLPSTSYRIVAYVHRSAINETGCVGAVWERDVSSYIEVGTKLFEFTSEQFEASLVGNKAVMYVPVPTGIVVTNGQTVKMYIKNATKSTPIFDAFVEAI